MCALLCLAALALAAPDPPPGAGTYVEIDYTNVPLQPGHPVSFAIEVFVAGEGDRIQGGYFGCANRKDQVEIPLAAHYRSVGYKAEAVDDFKKLRIYGRTDDRGRFHPTEYATVYTRGLTFDQLPIVRNPPPPPVEFDLGRVPTDPGRKVTLAFGVTSPTGDKARREAVEYDRAPTRAALAATVAERFTKAGFRADADGEKVRVRGWANKDGKFRPAARGTVASADLKPEQLPRVKGLPPAPCVVFDFAAVRRDLPGRARLTFEVTTAGGDTFREQVAYGGMFELKELAALLVRKGFHVEVDGEAVRVYGWVDDKIKLRPATGGTVTSADLTADQLPTVTTPPKN